MGAKFAALGRPSQTLSPAIRIEPEPTGYTLDQRRRRHWTTPKETPALTLAKVPNRAEPHRAMCRQDIRNRDHGGKRRNQAPLRPARSAQLSTRSPTREPRPSFAWTSQPAHPIPGPRPPPRSRLRRSRHTAPDESETWLPRHHRLRYPGDSSPRARRHPVSVPSIVLAPGEQRSGSTIADPLSV